MQYIHESANSWTRDWSTAPKRQDGKKIEDSKGVLSGTMKQRTVLKDFLSVVGILTEIIKVNINILF